MLCEHRWHLCSLCHLLLLPHQPPSLHGVMLRCECKSAQLVSTSDVIRNPLSGTLTVGVCSGTTLGHARLLLAAESMHRHAAVHAHALAALMDQIRLPPRNNSCCVASSSCSSDNCSGQGMLVTYWMEQKD